MLKFLLPKQPAFFEYFHRGAACLKEIAALFNELANNFTPHQSA